MGIKEWNSKKSQSFTFGRSNSSRRKEKINQQQQQQQQQCIRLGQKCAQNDEYDQKSRWKMLWKKIKKEKQRIFSSNNSFNNHIHGSTIAAYDPEAYSRNFDEGLECKEPEYLTRSFSARFADPSRISQR
ncbi:hypothetical protein BVRB_2g043880 [Beta vulgaris subsp. vulgaris]|nr:hypothetical protein BVRB_2g043880 [Beta vulgaris subsp. vulgaris]